MYYYVFMLLWYLTTDENAQPDSNLGGLCQSVSSTFKSSIDLSHLDNSFQTDHFQTLITHVCRDEHTDEMKDYDMIRVETSDSIYFDSVISKAMSHLVKWF